jgi:endonuclease/exonuclease/phosphatase family metal-dependent hydrolase
MKLCTFNIWNDKTNFEKRLELLIDEINQYDIDIVGLQEVKNKEVLNKIKTETHFAYGFYFDGLGILSKYEIKLDKTYSKDNNYILRTVYNDLGITVVHLDWKALSNRMNGLEAYFDMLEIEMFDTEIILGDFNDNDESELHYELVANDFIDIHQRYSHTFDLVPKATLDTINNPRWKNSTIEEEPERFDWVMVNSMNELEINKVELVGTAEIEGNTPSDHYGILVDIKINE